MTIKTILVPIEAADYSETLMSATLAFGRHTDGYVEGCALGVMVFDAAGVGAMGGMPIPAPEPPAGSAEELEAQFREFMRANNVPGPAEPKSHLSCGWRQKELLNDLQVAEYSRVFDLVVAGRPEEKSSSSPRLETVESCLFEGARPVLVVPPKGIGKIGETIVVAWNCSTEAARAVSFALSLLQAARRVIVLSVEGGMVPGPGGAELCASLVAQGIDAEDQTVPSGGATGETILARAQEYGADLVIKGAYTHSRLRQRIFGGATDHLLHHADVPVFMAS